MPVFQLCTLFLTLRKEYTFSVYFQTSAETFLLLTVLAHRARSRLCYTVNALYKLLTYLLTSNAGSNCAVVNIPSIPAVLKNFQPTQFLVLAVCLPGSRPTTVTVTSCHRLRPYTMTSYRRSQVKHGEGRSTRARRMAGRGDNSAIPRGKHNIAITLL